MYTVHDIKILFHDKESSQLETTTPEKKDIKETV